MAQMMILLVMFMIHPDRRGRWLFVEFTSFSSSSVVLHLVARLMRLRDGIRSHSSLRTAAAPASISATGNLNTGLVHVEMIPEQGMATRQNPLFIVRLSSGGSTSEHIPSHDITSHHISAARKTELSASVRSKKDKKDKKKKKHRIVIGSVGRETDGIDPKLECEHVLPLHQGPGLPTDDLHTVLREIILQTEQAFLHALPQTFWRLLEEERCRLLHQRNHGGHDQKTDEDTADRIREHPVEVMDEKTARDHSHTSQSVRQDMQEDP